VEGWAERYTSARTPDVPSFGRVIEWLRENCPDDLAAVPIHNDFRLDNLILDGSDPTRILGVLDWELATVGDPLTDLGAALAYWVEAGDDPVLRATRRQPTHLPGMLTRAELVARYLEKTGRSVPDFRFYEVLGMFRLAGIAQQIYWRYRAGQTRNPAFRRFCWIVTWIDLRCLRRIGWREVRWRPRRRSG
jgi:aminoglycoside phosphotransferase (APT) family kinase protein